MGTPRRGRERKLILAFVLGGLALLWYLLGELPGLLEQASVLWGDPP